MPSKSKAKGNRFERECVNIANQHGLKAKRAWGSDGRSLGLHPEVDMIIENYTVQCKVRKRIAEWLKPSEQIGDSHLQLVKESRGQIYAIMPMTKLMEIITQVKTLRKATEKKQ